VEHRESEQRGWGAFQLEDAVEFVGEPPMWAARQRVMEAQGIECGRRYPLP